MNEDWSAVARAINARTRELSMRQRELSEKSGVSLAIVREIQQGRIERRRNPRTLEALSTALEWHPQHLTAVLNGKEPPHVEPSAVSAEDPVVPLLNAIIREIRGLRAQIGVLANRLDDRPRKDE
ncbi:putative transcriptional regulator [Saccharothrix tamanrassetensis]|uniref:Putative transcriptional regulator n=1 Tax=Saccharothrix tamanrassetensis TaxID=1051531 RepID=A0A841CFX2_9PSEU|nr:hypothetical protein [Saccharothrix tamanrassetensis]MBB5955883.1 putative transcriptional regulator [Saccharothrix tamanrassetensis]